MQCRTDTRKHLIMNDGRINIWYFFHFLHMQVHLHQLVYTNAIWTLVTNNTRIAYKYFLNYDTEIVTHISTARIHIFHNVENIILIKYENVSSRMDSFFFFICKCFVLHSIQHCTYKFYNTNRLYKMLQAKIKFFEKQKEKHFPLGRMLFLQIAYGIMMHCMYSVSVFFVHILFTRNFKWIKYANCEILELLMMMMRSEKCFYFSISLLHICMHVLMVSTTVYK